MTALLDETLRRLDDCGCCAGIGPSVPGVVFNRPGLSAIAYRSATWHEFRSSLIAALSHRDHPALASLTTRDGDDFTIAFLDAVAAMGDVLTFYGERIATESYLRTATERRSILELARLIGYELKPGVAASTLVAFTVEDPPVPVGEALAPTRGDRRRRGEGPEHPGSRGEAADVRDRRADRGPGGMEHAAAEAGRTAADRRQPGVAHPRRHRHQAPAGRHRCCSSAGCPDPPWPTRTGRRAGSRACRPTSRHRARPSRWTLGRPRARSRRAARSRSTRCARVPRPSATTPRTGRRCRPRSRRPTWARPIPTR